MNKITKILIGISAVAIIALLGLFGFAIDKKYTNNIVGGRTDVPRWRDIQGNINEKILAGTGVSIVAGTGNDDRKYIISASSTTTGDWLGTWQSNSPSDFLSSSTSYIATTTGDWLGTWRGYADTDFLASTTDYVSPDSVDTLTNKTLVPRIGSLTSSTTLTIDSDLYDQFYLTEMTATTTIAVSGTSENGQKLILGITASTTAQGLVWADNFATSTDLDLDYATVANKTSYYGFIYNSIKAKWLLIAKLANF